MFCHAPYVETVVVFLFLILEYADISADVILNKTIISVLTLCVFKWITDWISQC